MTGGGGGVRPDERAVKQLTRWTGVFFWFYSWVSHFTCDLRLAAGDEDLTVNMHALRTISQS